LKTICQAIKNGKVALFRKKYVIVHVCKSIKKNVKMYLRQVSKRCKLAKRVQLWLETVGSWDRIPIVGMYAKLLDTNSVEIFVVLPVVIQSVRNSASQQTPRLMANYETVAGFYGTAC
jgi:hypothetical protein